MQNIEYIPYLLAVAPKDTHYSLSDPKLNDVNVNYKGNQSGEIRTGKTNHHKGKKKLSRKQRKMK